MAHLNIAHQPKPIPIEVVGIILSNLDKSDMLRCRLVNTSWNQESLRQLRRQSRWRKTIRYSELSSVVNFLKNSSWSEHFILPFKLYVDHEKIRHPRFSKYQAVQTLSDLFGLCGPNSVPDVELLRCDIPVTKILADCAPGLKKLIINFDEENSAEAGLSHSATQILNDRNLTFPNLRVLLFSREYNSGESKQSLMNAIILKSPRLQEICILSPLHSATPAPLDPSKSDSFKNLTKLKVAGKMNLANILNLFREKDNDSLPALTSLALTDDFLPDRFPGVLQETQARSALVDTLTLFSSTLQSLNIGNFLPQFKLHGIVQHSFQFPRMSRLRNLRLELTSDPQIAQTNRAAYFVNLKELNFAQKTFPGLDRVEIDIRFGWSRRRDDPSAFPSVSSLILLVPSNVKSTAERNRLSCREFLTQSIVGLMAETFPNLKKLAIHSCLNANVNVIPIIQTVIQSTLPPTVEKFELQDCRMPDFVKALEFGMLFGSRKNLMHIKNLRISYVLNPIERQILYSMRCSNIEETIAIIAENFLSIHLIELRRVSVGLINGVPATERLALLFPNMSIKLV